MCKYELRDELKNHFEGLGTLLIVSAQVTMVAFLVQYYMWRDYRDKYDPLQMYYDEENDRMEREKMEAKKPTG